MYVCTHKRLSPYRLQWWWPVSTVLVRHVCLMYGTPHSIYIPTMYMCVHIYYLGIYLLRSTVGSKLSVPSARGRQSFELNAIGKKVLKSGSRNCESRPKLCREVDSRFECMAAKQMAASRIRWGPQKQYSMESVMWRFPCSVHSSRIEANERVLSDKVTQKLYTRLFRHTIRNVIRMLYVSIS